MGTYAFRVLRDAVAPSQARAADSYAFFALAILYTPQVTMGSA